MHKDSRQRVIAERKADSLDHTQRLRMDPQIQTPESQLCY